MIWKLVTFLDRLIFCPHTEEPFERDQEGALWRVCTACGHRTFIGAHANILPLSRRIVRPGQVTPIARGKRA